MNAKYELKTTTRSNQTKTKETYKKDVSTCL